MRLIHLSFLESLDQRHFKRKCGLTFLVFFTEKQTPRDLFSDVLQVKIMCPHYLLPDNHDNKQTSYACTGRLLWNIFIEEPIVRMSIKGPVSLLVFHRSCWIFESTFVSFYQHSGLNSVGERSLRYWPLTLLCVQKNALISASRRRSAVVGGEVQRCREQRAL